VVAYRLRNNVFWNVGEVIGSSLVLYLVYRVVVYRLGLEALGLWALVVSATSIARMADMGASVGLSRYVAIAASAPEGQRSALTWIQTAFALNLYLYSALAIVVYLPAYWVLAWTTKGAETEGARALLPYSIACFTLMSIAGVGAAALTGLGRGDLKSKLMLVGLAVQALLTTLLVGRLGLIGIAVAQVVQYSVVLVGSWVLVRRLDPGGQAAGMWPFRIHRANLRALMGFGAKLQILNIVTFAFDPLTKFVFSATAGLAGVGLYELASRTILQVRQLIVAPAQNFTPLYAATDRTRPNELARVYSETNVYIFLTAAAAMGSIVIGSPLLSWIWFARLDSGFIIFTVILSIGWLLNIVASPSYLLGLALGRLRWNMIGTAVFALGAPLLGYLLHFWAGRVGVVTGIAVGAAIGGLVTILANPRTLGLPIMPSREVWVAVVSRIAGAITRRLNRI